jgi:aspartate kinase
MQHQIRNVDVQFIIDCAGFDRAVIALHKALIEDADDAQTCLKAA